MKRARGFSNYFIHYYTLYGNGVNRKTLKGYSEFREVTTAIWKTVRDHYVHNEGGVYIDNIGYLCHVIRPESKEGNAVRLSARMKRRKKRGGFSYRHVSIPIEKTRSAYRQKYAVFEPLPVVEMESDEQLLSGERYRFLYREVKEFARKSMRFRAKRIYNKKDLSCLSTTL